MDFEYLYRNAHLFFKHEYAKVYLVETSDRQYIMKDRTSNEYEYAIGCIINTIRHPNLVKTVGIHKTYLFTKKVSGMTFSKFHTLKLDKSKKLLLLRHVILALVDIQGRLAFTHYDLHSKNIIIEKHDNYEEYVYNCYGTDYAIRSPFRFKFIDYNRSYIEGMENKWTESNFIALITGQVPNVFDPFYDMALFYQEWVYHYRERNILADTIVLENKFLVHSSPKKHVHNMSYGISYDIVIYGREYNPHWIKLIDNPMIDDLLINDQYYNTISSSKRTLNEFSTYLFSFNEQSFKQNLVPLQMEFAAVMKKEKEQNIARRIHSPEALFDALMNMTN
jgi:hypothetical protein